MTEAIISSKKYSEQTLDSLRRDVREVVPQNLILITCGSFARREASNESDLDFFAIRNGQLLPIVSEPHMTEDFLISEIKKIVVQHVPKNHADGGLFGGVWERLEFLENIGGREDGNDHFTRRMLLLLEGDWISNDSEMITLRKEILEKYMINSITDHQLSLFLLNDIVRYYRTVMVDFEFKTIQTLNPKPWGTRNIKLVFSRKLLYASGLFSVAMTADRSRDAKIETLSGLFNLPVIDRLTEICGKSRVKRVLVSYDCFLSHMHNAETRLKLENIKIENRDDPLFRKLKNEGHHFTRELLRLFEDTFDSTHPIRRAILF